MISVVRVRVLRVHSRLAEITVHPGERRRRLFGSFTKATGEDLAPDHPH
jgi:hypothetical protein